MTALAVSERLLTPEEFYELEDSVAYELDDGLLEERAVSRLSSEIGAILLIEAGGMVRRQGLGKAYGATWASSSSPAGLAGYLAPTSSSSPTKGSGPLSRMRHTSLSRQTSSPRSSRLRSAPPRRTARSRSTSTPACASSGFYPETRRVLVYRADGSTQLVPFGGELGGEDVLPGFRLPLSELFGETKADVAEPGIPS